MNSFTCAPVIPSLVVEMKNPVTFPRVALWSFLTITVVFGSIGFAGYAGWGIDMLKFDLIVDAVASSAGRGDWVNYIVQISILVVSFTHLLVLFAPLGKANDRIVSHFFKGKRVYWTLSLVGRTVVFLAAMGLALLVPGFGALFNIVGSTIVMFLQILFPSTFFLRLLYLGSKNGIASPFMSKTREKVHIGTVVACICLGLFGLVLGTYQAIDALASK
mmetsp:Transcript_12968/g.12802  ORF Transcript_12968/g.12802 Transcript_12968/m.12802 type:complete len:218 (-) Transcript_12968:67-720(-)